MVASIVDSGAHSLCDAAYQAARGANLDSLSRLCLLTRSTGHDAPDECKASCFLSTTSLLLVSSLIRWSMSAVEAVNWLSCTQRVSQIGEHVRRSLQTHNQAAFFSSRPKL